MAIIQHLGMSPRIDPSAYIAPNATICGDVRIGPNCAVGFGAVVVSQGGSIEIGANCVIMDTAVLRGVRRNPLTIGTNVLIGPRACVTGCTVEDEAFIATGVTIFNGATIGRRAEIRVNAVVHLRTTLPADCVVPIGWIAVGDPARLLPPSKHEEIWAIQEPLDFPKYVFGVDRPPPGKSIMPVVMPRYSKALSAHRDDSTIT